MNEDKNNLLKSILSWIMRHKWLTLLAATVLLAAFPVEYRSTRMVLLVALLFLWFSGIVILRKRKVVMGLVLAAGILPLVWLQLPGARPEPAMLRTTYVTCLQGYEGSLYVWGGENRTGIDCSGLVRRGLINANLKQGRRTLNPRLIRNALSLWWHDCSARALRDQYHNLTYPITAAPGINTLDEKLLLPGDLAITQSGIHVLAYLGNGSWIQADPGAKHVTIDHSPSDNHWFNVPIHIMRWQQLNN